MRSGRDHEVSLEERRHCCKVHKTFHVMADILEMLAGGRRRRPCEVL
jgi:hypothetical protein